MKRALSSVALFAVLALAGCAGTQASQAPATRSSPSPAPTATQMAPETPVQPSPAPAPSYDPSPEPIPAPTVTPTPPSSTPATTGTVRSTAPSTACGGDSYRNVDGICVPRPTMSESAPPNATARCADGTYSFSLNRRGTCSHHGGVAQWLD